MKSIKTLVAVSTLSFVTLMLAFIMYLFPWIELRPSDPHMPPVARQSGYMAAFGSASVLTRAGNWRTQVNPEMIAPCMIMYPTLLLVACAAGVLDRLPLRRVKTMVFLIAASLLVHIAQMLIGFPLANRWPREGSLVALFFQPHYTAFVWIALMSATACLMLLVTQWVLLRLAEKATPNVGMA